MRTAMGSYHLRPFGQACIDPGMVKVTYGTGSFVLANAGPDRPGAKEMRDAEQGNY